MFIISQVQRKLLQLDVTNKVALTKNIVRKSKKKFGHNA